jgi:plasmid stabilization system protein ParE
MASQQPKRVVIAAAAVDELADVWRWNAQRYGPAHADAYVAFLKKGIDSLAVRFELGRSLPAQPDIQYVHLRRKSKGHGHVAVYRVNNDAVNVLHVFHTSQDWQTGARPEQ